MLAICGSPQHLRMRLLIGVKGGSEHPSLSNIVFVSEVHNGRGNLETDAEGRLCSDTRLM